MVRVFAGKAYIRQGSITQIVKSIRKSSMRAAALYLGVADFRRQGNRALCGDGREQHPTMGQRKLLGSEAFWAWPNAMRMRSDATPAIADGVHVIPRSATARMRPSAPVHVLGMRQRFR